MNGPQWLWKIEDSCNPSTSFPKVLSGEVSTVWWQINTLINNSFQVLNKLFRKTCEIVESHINWKLLSFKGNKQMYTCLIHKKFYSVTLLIHEQYKCKIDKGIDFIHSHMSHWHLIDNEGSWISIKINWWWICT